MKKKIVSTLLLSMLMLSSCGQSNSAEPAAGQPKADSAEISAESSESKILETEFQESNSSPEVSKESDSVDLSEKTLDDIEKYLLDKGVLSGNRIQMAADLIGGINGFKYDESNIEIYEYDINSDEYISLSNGEEINLQGMDGYTVGAISTNEKFVLMGEPSQDIMDAF